MTKPLLKILAVTILVIGFWVYKFLSGPPYEVQLNIPKNSVVGVTMQSTLNVQSAEVQKLPEDVRCSRVDNRTYGDLSGNTTRKYYKLYCEGREGFVLTYQVTLP